jgi:hypothetical protein
MINEIKIDDFKSWLESIPKDKVVGMPRTSNLCPLSVFIRPYLKGNISIGPSGIILNKKLTSISMSNWSKLFMSWVDSQYPKYDTLTSGQCLDWIDSYKEYQGNYTQNTVRIFQ